MVITAIIGGIISDRSGRRKMLVTVSGLLMAGAALLLAFFQTWPAAPGVAVLYGMGYGAYIAVDQALITQVLPKARDRAKDLGIINIAIVCPGAIGAAIAAPLVSLAWRPDPVRGDRGGGRGRPRSGFGGSRASVERLTARPAARACHQTWWATSATSSSLRCWVSSLMRFPPIDTGENPHWVDSASRSRPT